MNLSTICTLLCGRKRCMALRKLASASGCAFTGFRSCRICRNSDYNTSPSSTRSLDSGHRIIPLLQQPFLLLANAEQIHMTLTRFDVRFLGSSSHVNALTVASACSGSRTLPHREAVTFVVQLVLNRADWASRRFSNGVVSVSADRWQLRPIMDPVSSNWDSHQN